MKKENKNSQGTTNSGITRNEAIKKMGKYAALTAVGTFMILNPKEAQASSAPPGPGWGSGKSSWGSGKGRALSKPSLSKPSLSRPSMSKPSLLKGLKK